MAKQKSARRAIQPRLFKIIASLFLLFFNVGQFEVKEITRGEDLLLTEMWVFDAFDYASNYKIKQNAQRSLQQPTKTKLVAKTPD